MNCLRDPPVAVAILFSVILYQLLSRDGNARVKYQFECSDNFEKFQILFKVNFKTIKVNGLMLVPLPIILRKKIKNVKLFLIYNHCLELFFYRFCPFLHNDNGQVSPSSKRTTLPHSRKSPLSLHSSNQPASPLCKIIPFRFN